MTDRYPDAAVTDADLIRYLDGEQDDAERARIEAALAGDPALAVRLEQLRRRGQSLKPLLEATDPRPQESVRPARPPASAGPDVIDLNAAWAAQQGVEPHVVRPYRPLPGWVRAAAILAFLLAGSLLVPPVRAWLAGVLASVLGGR